MLLSTRTGYKSQDDPRNLNKPSIDDLYIARDNTGIFLHRVFNLRFTYIACIFLTNKKKKKGKDLKKERKRQTGRDKSGGGKAARRATRRKNGKVGLLALIKSNQARIHEVSVRLCNYN